MRTQSYSFIRLLVAVALLVSGLGSTISFAEQIDKSNLKNTENQYTERMTLLEEMSALTGIPWYYLAAVDQYERSLNTANSKTRPSREGLIAIYFPGNLWAGDTNPDPDDTHPASISFYEGIGRDGSGDQIADPNNDLDVIYTMSTLLLKQGISNDNFHIGLWNYYQNTRSVQRIQQFAKIYAAYGILDLFKHAFPVPLRSDHSYRSTWGARRSFGGYRIHEGTDIFARYGVPVRSTCYGIIEVKGWNRYGGWRVGIRDLNNVYHYYAHLSGYNKEVKEGDVVEPGLVVGWVGSSGYGKPGTQGKFAPHLHYGLYRDYGLSEWSFDPYSYLKRWEREERSRR